MSLLAKLLGKLSMTDVSFSHDYDSDLYMFSKDSDAKNWKVIVHCEDGKEHMPSVEKFIPYPGCDAHEGETAWMVDYYLPETIEIQKPGSKVVIIKYPNLAK